MDNEIITPEWVCERISEIEKRRVDQWNEKYPIGTPVIVTKDNGDKFETVTVTRACMNSTMGVIFVKGISSCYWLARVEPVERQAGAEVTK